jgi:hypothetical protein
MAATSLYCLLRYSRLSWAAARRWVAMVIYGAGTAGWTPIRPIFDEVLPTQLQMRLITPRSWRSISQRSGAHCRRFDIDVGQRVVHDPGNELFRHMLGQSCSFSAADDGRLMSRITNDVSVNCSARSLGRALAISGAKRCRWKFSPGVLVYGR